MTLCGVNWQISDEKFFVSGYCIGYQMVCQRGNAAPMGWGYDRKPDKWAHHFGRPHVGARITRGAMDMRAQFVTRRPRAAACSCLCRLFVTCADNADNAGLRAGAYATGNGRDAHRLIGTFGNRVSAGARRRVANRRRRQLL